MTSRTARVALVLLLALTACHNKDQVQNQPPLAPPIEDAPPPPPSNAPANLPPPVITVPSQSTQPATQAQQTPPQTPPKPKKHKKPAPSTNTDQQQTTTQVAQNDGSPKVSAEGNFTPEEPADLRQQTSTSIAQTEKGLTAITRKLNDQEQKTRAQILEFLKQAKSALDTGDVDGAHTLALKASVLLNELVQ